MSHSKELAAGLAGAQRSDRPLPGLFTGGTMTTEWTGPMAALGEGTPPQKCKTDNRPANEPSLPAMTKKAIEPPGRARPRHRGPRAYEPDRGRGLESNRDHPNNSPTG